MDVEMLESAATYYHVSRRCDQPQIVVRSRRVKAELPDIRVKTPDNNLDVVGWAFVVQVLEFRCGLWPAFCSPRLTLSRDKNNITLIHIFV